MDDLIRKQAAIAVVDSSDYVGLSVEDVKKVTDEVVKGLKRLPSAQPTEASCWGCNCPKMERLKEQKTFSENVVEDEKKLQEEVKQYRHEIARYI